MKISEPNAEYDSPSTVTISYNEAGQVIRTNEVRYQGDMQTAQTVSYVKGTDLVASVTINGSEEGRNDGVVKFTYGKKNVLLSKVFTPNLAKKKQEWGGEEHFWNYDQNGNLLQDILGDSLKWAIYIYDISKYNEQNDIVQHTYVADFDGWGATTSERKYSYDSNNNWITKTNWLTTLKAYPGGTTPDNPKEEFRNTREISYYR